MRFSPHTKIEFIRWFYCVAHQGINLYALLDSIPSSPVSSACLDLSPRTLRITSPACDCSPAYTAPSSDHPPLCCHRQLTERLDHDTCRGPSEASGWQAVRGLWRPACLSSPGLPSCCPGTSTQSSWTRGSPLTWGSLWPLCPLPNVLSLPLCSQAVSYSTIQSQSIHHFRDASLRPIMYARPLLIPGSYSTILSRHTFYHPNLAVRSMRIICYAFCVFLPTFLRMGPITRVVVIYVFVKVTSVLCCSKVTHIFYTTFSPPSAIPLLNLPLFCIHSKQRKQYAFLFL